jgi:molybdate transport system regulatory protein
MKPGNKTEGARLRVVLAAGVALGPGKADLLEAIAAIAASGSIAAAGRRLGMSYKRAWLLVETLNACFSGPLVDAARGGAAHGGARRTQTGEAVLARYRRMEALTRAATEDDLRALRAMLRPGDDAPPAAWRSAASGPGPPGPSAAVSRR